jgi:transporter family-2 protein
MLLYLMIPTFIGFMSVVQNALNRQVGLQTGLATAVFINACIVFVSGLLLILAIRFFPERFGQFVGGPSEPIVFKWWYLVPGIFGFCVIFGLPYAMTKLGALNVFICFVSAQVLGSMVWEALIDRAAPSGLRVFGAGLAMVGVLLVSWR